MKYLLDTNILIYLIKHQSPEVAQRVNALSDEDQLYMSFVTYAELLKGAERSTRKERTIKQLQALVRQVPVIYPSSSEICQHYAEQFTLLKTAGTPIGSNNLWIACHGLAEGATVVTHNTSEFSRIEGLKIEDWVH